MASGQRGVSVERAGGAFEPISEMLDSGRCEPLKAAVQGVLLVTGSVCAAYNAAAWLKRRQPHLAINAVIYSAAVWWERCHIARHLAACQPAEASAPQDDLSDAA
jgi:hypothetical protein